MTHLPVHPKYGSRPVAGLVYLLLILVIKVILSDSGNGKLVEKDWDQTFSFRIPGNEKTNTLPE